MGMYLMDPKCRQAFANDAIAKVIMQIMETKYSVRQKRKIYFLN